MVITLNFIGKIRDEHKFSSIYELQEQLSKDKVSALNLILRRKT
jgi:riboflavin kinase/FMN adenylyltransferase